MRRAFRAALTMNISMVDAQSRMAMQSTPITALQREQIRDHPRASVALLQSNGITDDDWLRSVAEHHERSDGKGYPLGRQDPSGLAHLIRCADIFTAKLSARTNRAAIAPDRAAREFFQADPTSQAAAAILKEFGIYPPGTFVRLASGECGIVIKRGASAKSPWVASLVNRHGEPMIDPIRRDASLPQHAVAAVVSEQSLRVRVPPERLVVLASG